MATAVTMPRLGLTMVEGTVVDWRARPGDVVEKGQTIVVIESEKVEIELEAFASGKLAAVYVEPGETVPIGALLGAIVEPNAPFDREAFAKAFVPETEGAPAGATGTPSGAREPIPTSRAPASGVKAAPAARAAAKKLGVELDSITGTGPGGRITVEDVERSASSGPGLSVAVEGAGPPLLLIPGFGVDKTSWRPQTQALKAAFTVITFDHRGIGASRPMPDESLTIATMAEDALSALGDRPPAIVGGASMGAAIAIELALARPKQIAGLVLITPVVEKDARLEAVLRSWTEFEAPQAEARIRSMLTWFLSRGSLAAVPKREAAAQALRSMAARTPIATLRHQARALGAWLGTRIEALGDLHVATLVIAGSEDLLSPRERAETVARAIPGARLEVLEAAAHAVTIEMPERVNRLIADLVGRA
jgi:pimeloyl-ACP methyl ester carboxylesterase